MWACYLPPLLHLALIHYLYSPPPALSLSFCVSVVLFLSPVSKTALPPSPDRRSLPSSAFVPRFPLFLLFRLFVAFAEALPPPGAPVHTTHSTHQHSNWGEALACLTSSSDEAFSIDSQSLWTETDFLSGGRLASQSHDFCWSRRRRQPGLFDVLNQKKVRMATGA